MKILFFAQARQFSGRGEMEIEAPHPMSADVLWDTLEEAFPGIIALRTTTRLARNCEYANPGDVFTNDDEVALIPPVSGG